MFSPGVSFAAALFLFLGLVRASPLQARGNVPYYDPTLNGGSMLSDSGEPLNLIISGQSCPDVLTDDGFLNYVRSLDMSTECMNQHKGAPQSANLGDGNGMVAQLAEYRHNFGISLIGTCLESVFGGNHLRMWRQNGPQANSGALFLAVSKEKSVKNKHTIEDDGYDDGRDDLVANAIIGTRNDGREYTASWQKITGLLTPGSQGINHGVAQDGVVDLLTVECLN